MEPCGTPGYGQGQICVKKHSKIKTVLNQLTKKPFLAAMLPNLFTIHLVAAECVQGHHEVYVEVGSTNMDVVKMDTNVYMKY